jgi:hypothetical protein
LPSLVTEAVLGTSVPLERGYVRISIGCFSKRHIGRIAEIFARTHNQASRHSFPNDEGLPWRPDGGNVRSSRLVLVNRSR